MLTRLLCLLASFTATTVLAQTPPPRDRTPAPPTGTATIKGRVVDAQTGSGLARARVHLQGFTVAPPKTVVTDDTGAFKLTEVVAGTLSIIVDRSGYMSTRYPEGGKTIRANIRSLTIADGQVLEGVNIPLYRGSAITGRVSDSHGEPAESVNIQLLRIPSSGHGRPQQRGNAGTNDLGEFRIARLDPGSYLLRAQSRNNIAGDVPGDVQTLPTYYPGVLSLDDAQPITIERGQTVAGIEIMLIDGTSSMISGMVVDATGQPAAVGTYVNARPISELSDMVAGGAGVRPDGSFRLKLAPGDYSLEVHAMPPGLIEHPKPGDQQFGRLRVSVGSAPLSDLTIVLGPGATMAGTLVFDGTTPPPNPDQILVGLNPPPFGSSCQSERGSVADGAFRVQGIVGTCMIRVMGNLGRWSVKSITQGDSDLMDRPVTFDPGQQLRNVRVVLTDKRTELVLNVVDDHGRATREYVGLVFSTDKTKWSEESPYFRVQVPQLPGPDRPATLLRGTSDIQPAPTERRDLIIGLPPGEYFVVAVTDIALEDTHDPSVLERLSPAAARASLTTDRGPVEISLRRIESRD